MATILTTIPLQVVYGFELGVVTVPPAVVAVVRVLGVAVYWITITPAAPAPPL